MIRLYGQPIITDDVFGFLVRLISECRAHAALEPLSWRRATACQTWDDGSLAPGTVAMRDGKPVKPLALPRGMIRKQGFQPRVPRGSVPAIDVT